jgi:hypothetical protein
MRKGWFSVAIFGLCLLISASSVAYPTYSASPALPAVLGFPREEPMGQLWAGSPTVVDIDDDGSLDILVGDNSACIWAWNNQGQLLAGFPWKTVVADCKASVRIRNSLAVGDIDGKPGLEVAAAIRGQSNDAGERGKIYVWDHTGKVLPGWPKEMDWTTGGSSPFAEAHSVVFANIIGDSDLEVLAGTSNSNAGPNLYAWYVNGTAVAGYPTNYKTAGIYGLIGAADMNQDGYAEVMTGRDHVYVHAYTANGSQLPGWPVSTYYDPNLTDWKVVKSVEFTHNAPAMGDLDGDGSIETVIAGRTRDNSTGINPINIIGSGIMVIQSNGTRRAGWEIPVLSGPPLHTTQMPNHAPALADLDDDGKLEIVVALFDGTIRAYRENGTPYWVYDYAQGRVLFGSEPIIGDVSGDGVLDVLFGTYSPDASANANVGLIGLNGRTGTPLNGYPLRFDRENASATQGVMAAPTIANIDADCNAELIAASMSGVVYAWELPVPFVTELMPWPTGRQNYQRTAAYDHARMPQLGNTTPLAIGDYQAMLPLITKGC